MTTGTQVNDLSTPAAFAAQPALDMAGTLEYEAGSNHFMGTVTTAGGMMGRANGVFYGPAAEEIGGTFETRGTGVAAYIGAFGAQR